MSRFVNPQPQYFSDLGLPLSEGLLYFYNTGSRSGAKYQEWEKTLTKKERDKLKVKGIAAFLLAPEEQENEDD